MGEVPFTPEAVTADWLSDAVGAPVRSFEMEQIGVGVGMLGRLFQVSLDADGGPPSVVAKFPTLDPGARTNVVEPLNFYGREVSFYREAVDKTPIRTPEVYAAEFDEASGDFVLLIEDLCGYRVEDQTVGASVEAAEAIIDMIAEHHLAFWGEQTLDQFEWLPRPQDPPNPQVLQGMVGQSLPLFAEHFDDTLDDDIREFMHSLPAGMITYNAQPIESTVTFMHGDVRLDNVFFDGDEPVLIDWQLGNRAVGSYDVAYFISQSLSTDARRQHEASLRERYLSRLEAGGASYDREVFDLEYRRTIAFCSIYPIIVAGSIEMENDRARDLVAGMLDRCVAAIRDHDAIAAFPTA